VKYVLTFEMVNIWRRYGQSKLAPFYGLWCTNFFVRFIFVRVLKLVNLVAYYFCYL